MGSKRYATLASLLFFLVMMCWAVASPIGSGPDADYHLSSIWCGWGESKNLCENRGFNGNQYVAEVPYMFQMCNDRPIEYFPECPEINSQAKTQNLRTASASQQNLYYKILRVFASENPNQSVLLMRFFNSIIAAFTFWGILSFTTGKTRFAALTSWSICIIPISIVYFSNINPRGWATLAVMSSWAFLAEALSADRKSKHQIANILFFVMTALFALCTRIDATVFVLFTSLMVVIWHLVKASMLNAKTASIGIVSLAAFAIAARQIPYVGDRIALNYPITFPFKQFILMQFTYGPESLVAAWGYRIGQQGNGPGLTGIIGVGLAAATISFALRNSGAIQRALALVTLIFIYLVTLRGSAIIQTLVPAAGEYILGLTVFFVAIIVYTSQSEIQLFENKATRHALISLISISHIISFFFYFEFYVKRGVNTGIFQDLNLNQTWWWSSQVNPNVVFFIGCIAFPLMLISAWNISAVTEPEIPALVKLQSKIAYFLQRKGQNQELSDKEAH